MAAVPRSALPHNRQLHHQKLRWCGSTQQMRALKFRARADGLPSPVLQQMAAIQADDEGRTLLDTNRHAEAEQQQLRAARLAEPFGWAFRRESMFAVNDHACQMASLEPYCRR